MNPIIRKAEREDVVGICRLLHSRMNPEFSMERWLGLFAPDWCADNPDIGLVVEDDGAIVGFHGHICSSRLINGHRERFVNFTSWYLMREYRGQGLGSELVRLAASDPDVTYSVVSLSPKRREHYRKLGLDVLEEERLLWKKDGHAYDNLEVVADPEEIRRQANPNELRVFEDHQGFFATPVLVTTRCTQCLLLLSRALKGDDVLYHDVLYRSNARLFTDRVHDIAEALLPEGKCVLAADRRFVDNDGPGAQVERIKAPRFCKSSRVAPADIDLAYSEVVLLGLKLD